MKQHGILFRKLDGIDMKLDKILKLLGGERNGEIQVHEEKKGGIEEGTESPKEEEVRRDAVRASACRLDL